MSPSVEPPQTTALPRVAWPRSVGPAVFAIAYLLASELGYALSLGPSVGGAFWPPSGLSLGVLLYVSRREWPLFVGAGVLANYCSDALHGQSLQASIGFAVANLLDPLVAARVVQWALGERVTASRLYEIVMMSAAAVFVSAPLASVLGAGAGELWTAGTPGFAVTWRTWWVGNAIGSVVVAPLALRALVDAPRLIEVRTERWAEATLYAIVLVAVTQVIFDAPPTSVTPPFLVFPVLLWAALRFGVIGVGGSTLLIVLLTTHDTALGRGPFAGEQLSLGDRLIALQLYVGVLGLSFHSLAALWEERTTALRALERANSVLEVRYRRLVEQAPLSILTLRANGEAADANAAWLASWPSPGGLHRDPRWGALGLRPHLERALRGAVTSLSEVWIQATPTEEPRCLRGLAFPVKDEHAGVAEVVVMLRDVTDETRAQRDLVAANDALIDREEALSRALARMEEARAHREELLEAERAARAEAERASRLKDEFLATLSHELRTPLNAVIGWANILRMRAPDPQTLSKGVQTIERNAKAQAKLIEDLLDMSRITSGKVAMTCERVEIAHAVHAALEAIGASARERGQAVVAEWDSADPMAVNGDPSRLAQVFTNLLSNAVKFTPEGGTIRVEAQREGGSAVVRVRDSGQGIAADFLPFVFDRFRQGDGAATRRHGGLGLGLSIAKQIVDLHGGSIEAASDGVGEGATFTVRLPLFGAAHAEDGVTPVPGEVDLRGVRLLVVDDDPDAREVLVRLVSERGGETAAASSAEDALGLLAVGAFDALLSDIGMPGVDGHELLRRVRAAGRAPRLAVAITAFARPEDRDRALAAGFDAHLAKPLDPEQLMRLLRRLQAPRVSAAIGG